MICVWLYRVASHVVPVQPGEKPPEGSRLLGYLELPESELQAWRETLARQTERDLGPISGEPIRARVTRDS
jgi:hypothetical protein